MFYIEIEEKAILEVAKCYQNVTCIEDYDISSP